MSITETHYYFDISGGTWQPGPWSECRTEFTSLRRLRNGLCHGTRFRNVSCLTQVSDKVPPLPCSGPEPPREAPCTVQCPRDCVVGPWSDWTACEDCGKLQSRNRAVLEAPSKRGKQCPTLTEVRTCEEDCVTSTTTTTTTTTAKPIQPMLRVGQWSECRPVKLPKKQLRGPTDMSQIEVKRSSSILITKSTPDDDDNEGESSGGGVPKLENNPVDDSFIFASESPEESRLEISTRAEDDTNDVTAAKIGTETRNLTCHSEIDSELPLR